MPNQSLSPAVHTPTDISALRPSPIDPSWIVAGSPQARVASLSSSADGHCWTDMWDCTAGAFRWRYAIDETIHIVEGGAVVTDEHGKVCELRPGDVMMFRNGTSAHWQVPDYVRKIAFCAKPVSRPANLLMQAERRLSGRGGRAAIALAAVTLLTITTTSWIADRT